jgi:PKD repeat protein
VGTLSSGGQELYVDGKRVGRRTDTTSAQPYSGYWRVGGDNLNGWPDQPASFAFAGDIAQVAVYPGALSSTRVQAHYTASGRTLAVPVKPADAYGGAVWDGQPDLYWRLDETSGTAAKDTMTNEAGGIYSAGVELGQPGSPAASAGRSINLPGGPQTVVASTPTSNPQVYSMEFWFKTTTTTGGRLMGFGNAPSGSASSNYDRHVYMFDDGRLRYGVWVGFPSVIDTAQSYNDGNWHHVVATLGGDGQRLYVDGSLAGSEANTSAENYTGYWRLGSDNTWGGSSTNDFSGSLDEVAVYPSVLSPATVQQHWAIGTGTAPNQAPVAAFTSAKQDLTVSVDGSGSSDADGTVKSYAWQFGDGGTATGATAQHTYAAAGTYQVTLTVTDDDGATGTKTSSVTVTAPPAPNTPPTAAFTSTVSNLTASFNGSGSSDADGSISSYSWQFGDDTTGVGASPQHAYAAAGTYQVTLTVTDDDGATASVTHPVTVTAPPATPVVAEDTFSRTVASGLGTAETGGAWTTAGTGVTTSVADGSARVSLPVSRTAKARLSTVAVQDVDVTHAVWLEAAATGGGTYLTTLVRTSSAGEYGAKVRIQPTGRVGLQLTRYVGGAETVLTTEATVAGITYTPGMKLLVRVQAVGSSPTTLQAKVWAEGGTEPASWLQSATDSASGLQGTGGVGFGPYVSASATATVVIRYDDLKATRL